MAFQLGERVSTPRGPGVVVIPSPSLILVELDSPRGVQVVYQSSVLQPAGPANSTPSPSSVPQPASSAATNGRHAPASAASARARTPSAGTTEPKAAPKPLSTPAPPGRVSGSASGNGRAVAKSAKLSQARQAIEALRFGLVPEERIAQLTVGFDRLSRWVASRFPDARKGKPSVSEVCGPFGTGKSHTMSAVRHLARERCYLTAHVEVDGKTISLSDPARLLFSLWSTLRGDGLSASTPVLDLFSKAMDASALVPQVAPVGIDRTHDNFAGVKVLKRRNLLDIHGDVVDALLSSSDDLTANEVNRLIWAEPTVSTSDLLFKPIIGKFVEDRPYDFVESLVGMTAVGEQAGFAGLVITIDEFEVEHNLTPTQMQRVENLIRVLGDYLEGKLRHRSVPLSIFFATVGQAGHRGDAVVDELLERANGDWHELRALNRADRARLAGNIHALYCEAYEIRCLLDSEIVNAVEAELDTQGLTDTGVTRAFIKRLVAALDSTYGPGAG